MHPLCFPKKNTVGASIRCFHFAPRAFSMESAIAPLNRVKAKDYGACFRQEEAVSISAARHTDGWKGRIVLELVRPVAKQKVKTCLFPARGTNGDTDCGCGCNTGLQKMRLVFVASILLVADLAAFALGFGLNLRTVTHGYNSRLLAKNVHTKVANRYGKNCGFARKCSKIAVNAADGRNSGSKSTVVPDSDLSGAWAEDGTRSKRWFEETELERQRKVVSVRVSHILVTAEEMAEALMTQIRSGDDFGELAKVISACEQSRAEAGAVGWVGRNDEHLDSILPESVRSAALLQKPGDVIQCKSPLGIHLVKVRPSLSPQAVVGCVGCGHAHHLGRSSRPNRWRISCTT